MSISLFDIENILLITFFEYIIDQFYLYDLSFKLKSDI